MPVEQVCFRMSVEFSIKICELEWQWKTNCSVLCVWRSQSGFVCIYAVMAVLLVLDVGGWLWRSIYASAANNRQPEFIMWVGPLSSVHPLIPILRDAKSPYLMERFCWSWAQIIIVWVGITEKVFKVRGQRSGSWRDQMHFASREIPIALQPVSV